jgi:hypothetical protein
MGSSNQALAVFDTSYVMQVERGIYQEEFYHN